MTMWKQLAGGAALSVLTAAIVQPALAQVTTSGVRGVVTTSEGAPAAGATVTVVDTRTNSTRTATTSANGTFDVRNLSVGGPYNVSVSAGGQQPTRLEGVFLNLGDTADLNLQFSGSANSEVVVVTATSDTVGAAAIGPSATFSLADLKASPAINRDIKDIIQSDPRIYLDPSAGGSSGSDGVQCAGYHPRFTSLTVDGVRLNDNFGLNANGFPTERIPFSFDAIQEVAVELAPFDVQYGGFTGCNINAVTKSGTNTFSGGAFFDYTDDGLTGDSTDGTARDLGSFEEKRYGVHIGGPIIPDRLFFFAAYEKFEGSNIFGTTPEDVGLTQAEYDAVLNIATSQYGYDAGGLPPAIPVEDEKFMGKLDWYISDRHRAAVTYNYNDGANYDPSDDSSTQIADGNHYYERGATLKSYTGALYSDWTDILSTEFSVSYLDLNNRQQPVAGLDGFGEVQVRVPNNNGGSTTVYLGADDSRHANKLNYDLWSYKAAANLALGDHTVTFGYEREEFEVFNLFVQEVLGEWVFDSPADFAAGDFVDFRYENAAGTNNVDDAGASFGYNINTLYAQDSWQLTPELNVVGGLRYDYYESDDSPAFNQTFFDTYGYGNDQNMDGRDLIQPRVGFTYDYSNDIQFRGGVGLFSGGNPNVWISNSYSNNGVTQFEFRCRPPSGGTNRCNGFDANINAFTYSDTGMPFFDVPQEGVNIVAAASGGGPVNALDPDFEIPSDWKVALGTTVWVDSGLPVVGNDWQVNADLLYSKVNEAAVFIPIGFTPSGTAPDGRTIYGGNTDDFLLTNAVDKGQSFVASVSAQKSWDNGLDLMLGYSFVDAEDTNPMTSSVAYSNFANYTTSDPVNISTATSDYQIAHRFTFQVDYEREFIANYPTRFSVFGFVNEGAPYSYTFATNNTFSPLFNSARDLAYIPTGASDPLIAPTSDPQALSDLLAYIDANDTLSDYRGQIAARNIARDDWWTRVDLKISQDFPGFLGTDAFQGFMVVENLGNLLNDGWGVLREQGFPGNAELYDVSIVGGQYQVNSFTPNPDADFVNVGASLWSVRFGVKYDF